MSENLPNKAVFQSYIWTCAKYDFSPYEKRIIYRLIEFAQHWLEGVKIKDHMHKIEPTDCGVNITMPVADILRDETDNNYAKAKAAFTSLSKKGAEYEDPHHAQRPGPSLAVGNKSPRCECRHLGAGNCPA